MGRETKWSFIVAVAFFVSLHAHALDVSMRYRSPRNPERKIRASTELIVLHTTEAPARSSLNKVSDRGECHFVVTESGGTYAIVDRDREAFHAGRSMWKGREDVDKFSIGIECVGYHNKRMPATQLQAIRQLVKELQRMYRISDVNVVAHSHVAYGAPNRWHRYRHRGRKRCGMLFAMPSVRSQLGLAARPAFDADVRAHRLRQADPGLAQVLYGNVDTMRGCATVPTTAVAVKSKPATPSVRKTAKAPASSGGVPKTVAELKALGYMQIGTVSKARTAIQIAGGKWKSSDTFYVLRGKVVSGTAIDPAHMEKGTAVWRRK